jgi:hypothetical protein
VARFVAAVGGIYLDGSYVVPCYSKFDFALRVQNNTYKVPYNQLIDTVVGYGLCSLRISGAETEDWILGDPVSIVYRFTL